MKGYLKDKNVSMMLFIACWVLYTVSVLGRYTFTDAMVKMISEKIFTESQAGFISGAFYIFYAVSQIISGRLGDRYSPFALMGLGVLISAFSNLLISFLSSYHDILILWCVNGFFQGMIWAPLIKLLSSVLCKEHRGLALFYISTTFYAGGLCTKAIAIYNFSQGSFRPIFKTSALILFIFFAIWVIVSIISTKKLVYDGKQVQAESKGGGKFKNKDFKKAIISSGFLLMIVPSLVKSMGDVGLKSWGATMIKSTYGLTESFATLMSLIVVLAGFSVPFVTRLIYKVTKSDEVKTSLYAFLLSVFPIIILMEVGIVNKYIELVMLIIVTVLMNIITQTLVIMGAARFEKWGGAATATGILNAAASVGVFLANYGFGLIAEFFGWKYIFVVLMALVLISSVCLLIAVPKWKRFKAEI